MQQEVTKWRFGMDAHGMMAISTTTLDVIKILVTGCLYPHHQESKHEE
jgi:hypothetical protein